MLKSSKNKADEDAINENIEEEMGSDTVSLEEMNMLLDELEVKKNGRK